MGYARTAEGADVNKEAKLTRKLLIGCAIAALITAFATPASAHRLKAKAAHKAAIAAAAALGPVAGRPYCPALLQLGAHGHRVVCQVSLASTLDAICGVLVTVKLRPYGAIQTSLGDRLPCTGG